MAFFGLEKARGWRGTLVLRKRIEKGKGKKAQEHGLSHNVSRILEKSKMKISLIMPNMEITIC